MRVLIYLVMALSFTSLSTTSFAFDVNGDGKEGLPEAVHALQVVSGMAPASSNIVFIEPTGTALENGTALRNRIDNITDASAANPYLLKIEPGTYDLGTNALLMQEYIDIEGSGQNTTKITAIGSGSLSEISTVYGADNAELRFITIENRGISSFSKAISNDNTSPAITYVTAKVTGSSYMATVIENRNNSSPILTNVTLDASGGTNGNYGMSNEVLAAPVLHNVKITATGGEDSYGIYNNASTPIMNNVDIEVSDGTEENNGVNNSFSSPSEMNNMKITVSGGSGDNYGVKNVASNAEMNNMKIDVSGGSACYGIYNQGSYPTSTVFPTNLTNIHITLETESSVGVYNTASGPVIDSLTIIGNDGGQWVGTGIENINISTVYITNSVINAYTPIIVSTDSFAYIISTTIIGFVWGCGSDPDPDVCVCLDSNGLMALGPLEFTRDCRGAASYE